MADDSGREERARRRMLRVVESGAVTSAGNPFVPAGAPFVPLGNGEGALVFFMDSHGAVQGVTARDLSRNNLARYCSAKPGWLKSTFPRLRKGQNSEEAETFKPELAADMIMNACGYEGPWQPSGRVRGRGAWRGEDGDLVLHCGDKLWINGADAAAGEMRSGVIYPRLSPIHRPHHDKQGSLYGPGHELFAILKTFNFDRGEFDARLVLGWIAAAMIGGALAQRPAIWLSGLRGSGKSTLVELIVKLFGHGGAVYSTNTTSAGVWQTLVFDSRPVILDETEPSLDNRRLNSLLEMMRVSYSGGDVQRGSSEGGAHQYPVRSSFLFSSINVVAMKAQDRSRCPIIELHPVDPTKQMPDLDGLAQLGRAILRRMSDQWPRLCGELIPEYRRQLIHRGWDARGADTYGTLFACGAALMNDDERSTITYDVEDMHVDLAATLERHKEDEVADWAHCINHLRGALIDPWRSGERRPIGELIRRAAGYASADPSPGAELPQRPKSVQAADLDAKADQALDAARAIMAFGLKVVVAADDGKRYVAVANQSAALANLFRDTLWAGMSGTATVWRQSLLRAPGARIPVRHVYFRDGKHRAVLVPLELFLGLELGEDIA